MQRITIIGLGLIGSSLGMALKGARGSDVQIAGYDADQGAHNNAKKIGAVDNSVWNLDDAVRDADIVIVATPAGAIREIFEAIGPHLKSGATVTDTASTKRVVLEWADELLPRSVGFVGGNPLTGSGRVGQRDAVPELFRGARYAIVSSPRAPQGAVGTVNQIVEQIGARPFFLDAGEHDSFAAAVSGLPAVLSAALMACAARSPSWAEISRFVGQDFHLMTGPAGQDPSSSYGMALTNPDMMVHWIDQMIDQLRDIRDGISEGADEGEPNRRLADTFVAAWEARAKLEAGIEPGHPSDRESLPTSSESVLSLFLGSRAARLLRPEKKKDPTNYDRRKLG